MEKKVFNELLIKGENIQIENLDLDILKDFQIESFDQNEIFLTGETMKKFPMKEYKKLSKKYSNFKFEYLYTVPDADTAGEGIVFAGKIKGESYPLEV